MTAQPTIHVSEVLILIMLSNICIYNLRITIESCSVKRSLNASAKGIDSCQSAQSAEADLSRNFSQTLKFLYVKRSFYIVIESVVGENGFLWIHNYVMSYLVKFITDMH